ncbi:MAG TPA: Xaa-Pro peptidase family protein [Gaiellaceae bacterium]|nr:Xaa-Pro peptidase family protein [Gaiellaceae bacterium]
MSSATIPATSLADGILGKLLAAVEADGLDAIVATSPENVAYISGAAPPSQKTVRSRIAAAIVPRVGGSEVIAVSLEGPVVRLQSRLDSIRLYQEFLEDPIEVIAQSLTNRGLAEGTIGVEARHLSVAEHQRLTEALPKADFVVIDDLLAHMRTIKTAAEIEAITVIGRAADAIALEVREHYGAGSTEREIASFVAERYADAGGDGLTMLVVGSGPRSAAVNAPATGRVLEPGDILRLDIIGTKAHYHSDVARTFVVGKPSSEQQRIYDLLLGVHNRCLESLRPGAITSDIYRIYKMAMDSARLEPYHFVGHGLGITLHEEPFINELRSIALEPGMVLCIEPLTLLDGRFGIQIEDEVVITVDGYNPISSAPELLTLEG